MTTTLTPLIFLFFLYFQSYSTFTRPLLKTRRQHLAGLEQGVLAYFCQVRAQGARSMNSIYLRPTVQGVQQ